MIRRNPPLFGAGHRRASRVRRVIEPMRAGAVLDQVPDDDIQYVLDLGLCRMANGRGLTVANPIYREVLLRALAFTPQASREKEPGPRHAGE